MKDKPSLTATEQSTRNPSGNNSLSANQNLKVNGEDSGSRQGV